MQQNHQTERDKSLLRLQRERNELQRRRRQMVPIDPPIQRGWVRRWRLTRIAKLRGDADVLRTILAGINTRQYCWRRSFKPGKRAPRRQHVTGQGFRVLHEWDWHRLGWPEGWKYLYFRRTETIGWQKQRVVNYILLREEFFELYTERHFIREMRLHQPEVDSRLSEIEAELGADGTGRLNNLTGSRWRRWCSDNRRRRERATIDRRRIRLALLGDWEAERIRSLYGFRIPSASPKAWPVIFMPA